MSLAISATNSDLPIPGGPQRNTGRCFSKHFLSPVLASCDVIVLVSDIFTPPCY